LGSSGYSAQLAGMVGAGFSFVHHFSDYDAVAAMLSYREHFKASAAHATPYAMLTVAAVCADSDAEAERLAATLDLNWALRGRGDLRPLASPEEALASLTHRSIARASAIAENGCSSARPRTCCKRSLRLSRQLVPTS